MTTRNATRSAELQAKLALVIPQLGGAFQRLAGHPGIADLYGGYLLTMHWMIRASVPLMEEAVGRARDLPADPVTTGLTGYLEDHIVEERSHDDWLLDDLEVLGMDRSSVLRRPPSATVAAMVGAQYYWIYHHHPVALLGYISVMEGYPPAPAVVDDMESRTGHPTAAFRTLRLHASLDPGHGRELDAVIDGLGLDDDQAATVGMSAIHTVGCAARAFDEISMGGRR